MDGRVDVWKEGRIIERGKGIARHRDGGKDERADVSSGKHRSMPELNLVDGFKGPAKACIYELWSSVCLVLAVSEFVMTMRQFKMDVLNCVYLFIRNDGKLISAMISFCAWNFLYFLLFVPNLACVRACVRA